MDDWTITKQYLDSIFEKYGIEDLLTMSEIYRQFIDLPLPLFRLWVFFRFKIFKRR